MTPATEHEIGIMKACIDLYKVRSEYDPDINILLHNLSFSEDILQTLLDLNSIYILRAICWHQPLSKEFIAKNMYKYRILEYLLDNKNIPEDTKIYIKMFL